MYGGTVSGSKACPGTVPPDSESINNNNPWSAMRSIRSPTRVFACPACTRFNDDWNALLAQSYQNMERGRRVLPKRQ